MQDLLVLSFTASVTVETQEYWNLKPDIDASAAQLNSPVYKSPRSFS